MRKHAVVTASFRLMLVMFTIEKSSLIFLIVLCFAILNEKLQGKSQPIMAGSPRHISLIY